MNLKRLDIFLLLFSLILCFSVIEINAQKKITKKTATKKKTLKRPQIISAGVLNGRAGSLVKPNYPLSARFVKAKGSVLIEVLIDEEGNIIEAKAVKGHPLLIPESLKAALKSKFMPIFAANKPVQVYGTIVYHYISDEMNWLEIGFSFDSRKDFYDALPSDFVDEKLMLIQVRNLKFVEKKQTFDAVENLIKSKISNDEKKLWLFSLGRSLNHLSLVHWNSEQKKMILERIQIQLLNIPNGVSPNLERKLENLVSDNSNDFNNDLLDLLDKLYVLGN